MVRKSAYILSLLFLASIVTLLFVTSPSCAQEIGRYCSSLDNSEYVVTVSPNGSGSLQDDKIGTCDYANYNGVTCDQLKCASGNLCVHVARCYIPSSAPNGALCCGANQIECSNAVCQSGFCNLQTFKCDVNPNGTPPPTSPPTDTITPPDTGTPPASDSATPTKTNTIPKSSIPERYGSEVFSGLAFQAVGVALFFGVVYWLFL